MALMLGLVINFVDKVTLRDNEDGGRAQCGVGEGMDTTGPSPKHKSVHATAAQ